MKKSITFNQLKKLIKESEDFESQDQIIEQARKIGYAMIDAAIEAMKADAEHFPDAVQGDPDFLLGNYLVGAPHADTVVDGYTSMKEG